MSVFSDFQRLWQEKFPGSDLSNAWIEDVKLSLTRHKEKIVELKKELEQETLYVEYLERLLDEVEKYRDNGSDPGLLFDAATPTINTSNRLSMSEKNGLTDNKDTEEQQQQQNQLIRAASSPVNIDDDDDGGGGDGGGGSEIVMRKKETDEVQLRRDGALNQFISELSSNIHGRRYSEAPSAANSNQNDSSNKRASAVESKSDSNDKKIEQNSTIESNNVDKVSDSSTATESERRKSDLLAQPSHFVTVIEVKESTATSSETANTTPSSSTTAAVITHSNSSPSSVHTTTTSTSSFKAIRSGYENVIIENNKRNSNLMNEMDRTSNTTSFNSVRPSAPIALLQDAKKKIPPRPPPKFPRRAAPVEPPTVPILTTTSSSPNRKDSDSSPTSSLERNVKPSEIFRQKSSDSLDIRTKKDITKFSKSSDLITDEFGKKLAKSESLKSTQSSSGSLGSRDTKSTASPLGSMEKINRGAGSVGSKESLHSGLTSGVASTKIKSFESISSLSSDSIKISQNIENEPYYDSVPVEANDSDFVYVPNATNTNTMNSTGTTGSSSSRDEVLSNAGSTLPMNKNHHLNSQTSVLEPESPGRSSNYVNIDYFLNHIKDPRNSSIDSDGELDINGPPLLRAISDDGGTPAPDRRISSTTRGSIINQIISSIISSETLYVECLNKMTQYMKAIRATLTTSQPVISDDDFQTVFFKIEELNNVHGKFLADLKEKQRNNPDNDIQVGELFKGLADNIQVYGAFLHNYGRAIDTVKKCGLSNPQFKEIVSNIILNSTNEQSLTLEDLLHKPVARVQKNALVLQDLIQHTPESHPDFQPLKQAHKITRNFLSEFNVIHTKSMSSGDDKALRRLVKNSFIVELADGHRKLRHLFLFNDVIACAKYKPSGRERFEFELKWFIPLKDIFIVSDESSPTEPKESSPVNIVQLKSQASTVRDQIMMEERDEKKSGSRANDKHKKKLADIEAQLVLASPNLIFKIGNKASGKQMTFFLSSDFERTQWIESILSLQKSCNLPGANSVSIYELSAWISACQKIIKTEMGSYLMRNSRDESLLVGDLHFTVQGLAGLDHPADLYVCIEIDSYGHYFRKAKTKIICHSTSPMWNESFVLELEGSQNLRVLVYQDDDRPILRAKHVLELSRVWLKEVNITKALKMTDSLTLNTTMRFIPAEISLRRVPTSKAGALFGAKLSTVLKREKRDIPFIISASIREVERRGMNEVGIYRVSGSASDLQKLKKSFESNAYEAEQLLKEVDIHSVTGNLKSYLRELPEALFTDLHYQKFFDTFNQFTNANESSRIEALQKIFHELPQPNKSTIGLILDHLIRVNHHEGENKMSLHNLAMVFGPTLLRPGPTSSKQKDLLESSTVDVMAQAGILYCFLQAKLISH